MVSKPQFAGWRKSLQLRFFGISGPAIKYIRCHLQGMITEFDQYGGGNHLWHRIKAPRRKKKS